MIRTDDHFGSPTSGASASGFGASGAGSVPRHQLLGMLTHGKAPVNAVLQIPSLSPEIRP